MPSFITPADVDFFKRINKEVYKLFFFPITVMKLIKSENDRLYGEDLNKQFDTPYTIEGYIPDLPKWHLNQGKFGSDEQRNLRVFFSLDLVVESGRSLPDIGDRMVIQNDLYQVMQVNPSDFGSNLQLPLTHVCEIIRVRPEKFEGGTIVQQEY
jgi:hypothetical protein